ncbi:hypothetical protein PHYC_03234 [Phycisphaerales bacterium]|nr:hypothetical protein PHYC_03234 [Phycisphaerales bacterium]
MTLRFEDPLWAWLIPPALIVTLLGARWLISMSPARRFSAVFFRLALLGTLIAALAGMSAVRRVDTLAVVCVVDVSGSVQRYFRAEPGRPGLERVREFLQHVASERGPDDLLGAVVFDGRAVGILRPSRGELPALDFDTRLADGTNIAEAIRLARALVPPDAASRLVLFTDGNQTAGDALAAAAESSGRIAPIDTVPLRYELVEEVVVEALDAPPTAAADSSITVRVALSATAPSNGTIRLLREGEEIDINGPSPGLGRRVTLNPGLNVERIEIRLAGGRVHRFRVLYEPDTVEGPDGRVRSSGDTIAENNRADTFTVTPGRGSVLLATEAPAGGTLASVLREAGAEVTIVTPEGLPTDLLSLEPYDLVLLDNVPAEVPEAVQRLLGSYVSDLGGGLVMIGGQDSFAPGGWRGSLLEPLLPVKLDLPDLVVAPDAATIFILDNSGSMSWSVLGTGQSQQEIANDAAALAIRSLDRRDLVGVITFNSQADILVPLAPNAHSEETVQQVRGILSGGGTNVVPALELAIKELRRAGGDAKIKHVVVLSDGVSRGRDRLTDLVTTLAGMDAKVSTVAVGDGADLSTMRRMAEIGNGSYFHATNAAQLPRLLLKAVRVVRTPLIREQPFTPVVLPTGSPITAGLGEVPPLGGLVLTRPRPEPTITLAMASPEGDPLLATWNVGLGQVAAWTSDSRDWSSAWIDSPAYRRLWTQVLHTVARAPEHPGLRAESDPRTDRIALRLTAQSDDGAPLDGLTVPGTLFAPSGASTPITLTQTGPGVYEGEAPSPETGSYIAVLKPSRDGLPLSPVITGTSVLEGAEFRPRSSDTALLARISEATKGRVLDLDNPAAARLWDRAGVAPREAVSSLWRRLVLAGLALLLLDIATRRVAWDRWVSRRFNPDLGRAEALERARGAGAARTTEGLRAAAARHGDEAPAIALGEAEARTLAQAARDRRHAERLAGLRTESGVPIVTVEKKEEPTKPEGLLAAKKRARERMDDGGG